jgi:hypothetical protein
LFKEQYHNKLRPDPTLSQDKWTSMPCLVLTTIEEELNHQSKFNQETKEMKMKTTKMHKSEVI